MTHNGIVLRLGPTSATQRGFRFSVFLALRCRPDKDRLDGYRWWVLSFSGFFSASCLNSCGVCVDENRICNRHYFEIRRRFRSLYPIRKIRAVRKKKGPSRESRYRNIPVAVIGTVKWVGGLYVGYVGYISSCHGLALQPASLSCPPGGPGIRLAKKRLANTLVVIG